jgi:4-aminobutyrate aminotransferase-like enzyme
VGKVSGRGLFLGVELVRDKRTKEPLSRTVTRAIFDESVRRGLFTMAYAPSFRLQPALTIDKATAENGLAVLREVFDHVKKTKLWEQ